MIETIDFNGIIPYLFLLITQALAVIAQINEDLIRQVHGS